MRLIYLLVLFAACNSKSTGNSIKDSLSLYYSKAYYYDTLAKIQQQYYNTLLKGQAMADSFDLGDLHYKEQAKVAEAKLSRYTDSLNYYKRRITELKE